MPRKFIQDKVENDVLIVDAINLAFRYKHRGQTEFVDEYISTVESLARSYKCGKIIILCDLYGSDYRNEIFPEYKGNRQKLREKQTEEEAQEFKEFFEEFEATLDSIKATTKHLLLRYKGVEADDLAAYLVKYKSDYDFGHIWLISSDKDWDLLINEDVSRFSYVTRKETTLLTWEERYPEIRREDYISHKCLAGDTGDNVPGITGIGPKRSITLLNQFGTAFDIYDACPIDSKYKYVKSLNEEKEQILINYQLMDLLTYCEEAIGPENVEEINISVEEFMNGSV